MKTHKNNWEERFDDSFPRPLKKEFIDDLEKTYKDTEFVLEPVKNVKGFIRQELASQKEENDREIDKYKDALIWCSGSDDFQLEGKARKGWEKLCIPLLK